MGVVHTFDMVFDFAKNELKRVIWWLNHIEKILQHTLRDNVYTTLFAIMLLWLSHKRAKNKDILES